MENTVYLAQRVRVQLGQPVGALEIERYHVGFVGFNPIAKRKGLRHVCRLELLP